MTKIQNQKKFRTLEFRILLGFVFLFALFAFHLSSANAATLSVSPASGTFTVGSTFDVSLFLNTGGKPVNAIAAFVNFPSDKLQLISPSAGRSIIEIWTAPPKFNNQTGQIELQGGIPGGINVSSGLITTLTFRVKSVGSAVLRFLDDSRVLLHDGVGTDALENTTSGVYQLILPPPAGPIVASETHPDQSVWYPNPNVVLRWGAIEGDAEGYSYVFNEESVDIPDGISEGARSSVTYKNASDGIHYFHIKALREGSWGGATHFAVKIDTNPPAEFPIEIIPSARTTRQRPVIQFETTDVFSGIDHYELKLVPLEAASVVSAAPGDQPLFIEVGSPHIPSALDFGSYDIIVRAYDKAQNYRESVERLHITNAVFQFVGGRGLEIKDVFVISWIWIWGILGFLVLLLGYIGWRARRWHHRIDQKRATKEIPDSVKQQLEELKRYRAKYGIKALLIFLFLGVNLFVFAFQANAQQIELAPPLVTTISRNISNEEIFYVGGKTESPYTHVVIYLQNLQSGETISQTVESDKRGDWFYRHDTFVTSGKYLLWGQSKIGDQLSPPSPQVQFAVHPTAIQFGASRLSYEIIYLVIIGFLLFVLCGFIWYIAFHVVHGRKKHKRFMKEVREAEESIRRGFAVLRRDIQAELAFVRKANFSKALSEEEKVKEEQLLKDLAWAEQYIGKEVWDVEETEHSE